jgi:hypothetical protein
MPPSVGHPVSDMESERASRSPRKTAPGQKNTKRKRCEPDVKDKPTKLKCEGKELSIGGLKSDDRELNIGDVKSGHYIHIYGLDKKNTHDSWSL